MILADQIATNVNWMLIASILMSIGTVGMWMDARKARKTTLDQPVDVRLVKALHEEFANKLDVQVALKSNTERHAQLFRAIEKVEREARAEMDRRFVELARDRKETMDRLNDQFTFIRENISSINTEMKLKRHL